MFRRILAFFKTGPERPRIEDLDLVRRLYERRRASVFLSTVFGYATFYVCRINFSAAKTSMLDEGVMTATEMGVVGSCLLVGYAIGKAVNGFLADRANVARFMSTGLLLSALLNLGLGLKVPFLLFAVLWGFNGWLQAAGAAPCIVSLSQWFSRRERGSRYGVWCVSHNLGEGITFILTASLVAELGWRAGFIGPGILSLASALVLYHTLADRPETLGLPPVDIYKNDPVPKEAAVAPVGELQAKVLRHFGVWVVGISSALMYIARYAMNHWGFVWLEKGKAYDTETAGLVLAIYSVTGFIGSFTSGIISDRFFASRRNELTLAAGVVEILSLVALYVIPPGNIWLDAIAMALWGYAMGILVAFLGGLMAVDMVPPRAAGAAAGLVGMVSYVGAAIGDSVSGRLIDLGRIVGADGSTVYTFEGVFMFWVGASTLSAILALLVWNVGRGLASPAPRG